MENPGSLAGLSHINPELAYTESTPVGLVTEFDRGRRPLGDGDGDGDALLFDTDQGIRWFTRRSLALVRWTPSGEEGDSAVDSFFFLGSFGN